MPREPIRQTRLVREGTNVYEVNFVEERRQKVAPESGAAKIIFDYLKNRINMNDAEPTRDQIREWSVSIAAALKAAKQLKD